MLNAIEIDVVTRVKTFLTSLGNGEATGLASELDGLLASTAATRASVAKAAQGRGTGKPGRAPSTVYAVELEPGWARQVTGARAAHEQVRQVLDDHGWLNLCPSQAGLAAMLSKNGQWATTMETDNGTVSLTVRKLA